jgi:riboflavin kinase/FMN adenylyltransferase
VSRVVTIGVFDGVHRGHQALITQTVAQARAQNIPACVLTFDPHPAACFAPQTAPKLLCTPTERATLLRGYGADEVRFLHFDTALATLSPVEFCERVLRSDLNATTIVIGEDFRFGQGRAGDAAFLRRAGFAVQTIPSVAINGVPARSSTIREALEKGDVTTATLLLGRPYTLTGTVVQGRQLGRTLGYPTANLATDPVLLIPTPGVYAGTATVAGVIYPVALSIGDNPTIAEGLPVTVEAYLIGYSGNLYGQSLTLTFHRYLRPMLAFATLDDLKAQMAIDVQNC